MRTLTPWLTGLLLITLAGCGKGGGSLDADLKYLPANCQVVGAAKVGDILNSPTYKEFMAQMTKAGGKGDLAVEFKDHMGLTLADIGTATFGVNGAGDYAVVLQMTKPVTAAEIIKNLKPRPGFMVIGSTIEVGPDGKVKAPPPPKDEVRKFTEVKVGGYTIHEEEAKFDNLTFCVVNPTTVVLGEAKSLQAVLQRDKKAELSDSLKKAMAEGNQSHSVWVALDAKAASQKLPPPQPGDPAAALQQSAGDVDAAYLQANLGKDSDCSIFLLCQDGAKAAKIKTEIDKLVPLAKKGAADMEKELGPMAGAIAKPLNEILDSLKIDASGSKVTARFKGSPVVVALTAIQLLGTQATTTFQTVGQSIEVVPPAPPQK